MKSLPTPSRAILVRVAADHSFGNWNGPCNPTTREFVYVPIPQELPNVAVKARFYEPLIGPALRTFSARNGVNVQLPHHLCGQRMHLDPDFDHLTYGDTQSRGRNLLCFREGDWVLFYAGLRSVQGGGGLVYGLIGLLVIDSVRRVADIPSTEYDRNAHTRLVERTASDVVVSGKAGLSGRFSQYIDIGEFRDRSYRVRRDLLATWGGLGVRDGWIQRSANPPLFLDPARFAVWLRQQDPVLHAANNPSAETRDDARATGGEA